MPIIKCIGPVFKIILLGESKVGKSSLLYKYSKGRPPSAEEIEATIIMDHVEKLIDVAGTTIKFSIWDPSGVEKTREAVTPTLYRKADCVIFVYDVTAPKSFEMLNNWLEECEKHNVDLKRVPVVLLANKNDLKPVVPEKDGQEFAKKHNMMFFKTSSLLDEEVSPISNVFTYIAGILKHTKKRIVPKKEEDEIVKPSKKDLEQDNSNCCEGIWRKLFWFLY